MIGENSKVLRSKEAELEAKARKRLAKLENELKAKLEAEYTDKLNRAIECKEREFKIKHAKTLEQERINLRKELEKEMLKEVKDEWCKVENEKIEIGRQKAALSVRLDKFNKQKAGIEQRENLSNTKEEESLAKHNSKKPGNNTVKYEYKGKLLLPLNRQLVNKTLNSVLAGSLHN